MNFIDVQVNGYAGVDFNGDPVTEAQIEFVAQRLRADGVAAILPTVITDDAGRMSDRLANLRRLIDQDDALRRMFPAFHIEGPFISPVEGYRGAHPPEQIRPASVEVMDRLLDAAGGPSRVALVTLAPECDKDLLVTRRVAEQGIHVAAGHTDAPLEILREAEQAGLDLFTHLGNGCANDVHRHHNIINRALSLERIRYSLIADGHHVPWYVLKSYLRVAGPDRCIITTDCIPAASAPADFELVGHRVIDRSGDTPVARFGDTQYLAGSCVTMGQCYDALIRHVGLTEAQSKALCVDHPRDFVSKWLA
jgi:N-acetylglucosamine-6-phosphate deacetylase